ncbi:MAG: hypothetical protein ACI8Z1_003301 [Candidatus Azotimanducaceae bacterium]|jgi:hypothetical protein
MRTTINHALDILENIEIEHTEVRHRELIRIVRRVQTDYLEIIETALSLLVQNKEDECQEYLKLERQKLDETKSRIGELISGDHDWPEEFQRLTIEYLFTRARLVDEIRMFPDIALELLERLTLDQSLSETITYLENAMTGKNALYQVLIQLVPDH